MAKVRKGSDNPDDIERRKALVLAHARQVMADSDRDQCSRCGRPINKKIVKRAQRICACMKVELSRCR